MPDILKIPYVAPGANGYHKKTLLFYIRSAKITKNKYAQNLSLQEKTSCILKLSIKKIGKNKCRHECNKNCVPQCNL